MKLINFDDPNTISAEIFNTVNDFKNDLKTCITDNRNIPLPYNLREKIKSKMPFLDEYEMTGWHHTRVVDIQDMSKNGIVKPDINNTPKLLKSIAERLEFDKASTDYLINKCLKLYNTQSSRIGKIYFTSRYLPTPEYKKFMLIIGGEALERSLCDDLKNEPFIKLADYGVPVGIKFKYNYKDVFAVDKDVIVDALIKYVYTKESKVLMFDAAITQSVLPNDILLTKISENVPYYFSDEPFE